MAEILIVEDEKNIREALANLFVVSGHGVRLAANGAVAVREYERERPDLILLDVMMPKKDGFEVLQEIRRQDALLPIILVTARGEVVDKIKALGLGADDYVTKPFELDELLARVDRALRRADLIARSSAGQSNQIGANSDNANQSFTFANLTVDPARMCAYGEELPAVELSAREIGILRLLAQHPGEVLGREHLLGTLWGVGHLTSTRTLDQHIMALRRKLGAAALTIEMVYGVGYRYLAERLPTRAKKRK